MAAPNAAQIKEGVEALVKLPDFAQKYKTIGGEKIFAEFHSKLNAWLETNMALDAADGKLLKQVIKQHFKGTFDFGKIEKIGGTDIAQIMPLVSVAATGPQYTDLKKSWSTTDQEYPKVRNDVSRVLGIVDKTHVAHGSNFKGTQTLEQIIRNLCDKVEGKAEIPRIKAAVLKNYKLVL